MIGRVSLQYRLGVSEDSRQEQELFTAMMRACNTWHTGMKVRVSAFLHSFNLKPCTTVSFANTHRLQNLRHCTNATTLLPDKATAVSDGSRACIILVA